MAPVEVGISVVAGFEQLPCVPLEGLTLNLPDPGESFSPFPGCALSVVMVVGRPARCEDDRHSPPEEF
jgi:hypothetical protein